MATEHRGHQNVGVLSVRWYHVAFILAFGVGGALLPPTGAVTIAGWAGGALGSLTTATVVGIVALAAVRYADDWRPSDLVGSYVPDSRFKFLVFTAIAAQLFILGTALRAGVSFNTLMFLLSPLNVLIGLTVAGDIYRLQTRGISWERAEYGYAAASLLLGLVAGLGYWYQRGRKRAEWVDAQASDRAETDDGANAGTDTVDTELDDASTAGAGTDVDDAAGTAAEETGTADSTTEAVDEAGADAEIDGDESTATDVEGSDTDAEMDNGDGSAADAGAPDSTGSSDTGEADDSTENDTSN